MSSLLNKQIIEKLDTKNLWFFRFKKLDTETMLITNDLWAYSYLTNNEFKDFIKGWSDLTEQKKKELSNKKFFKNTNYYYPDYKYEYGTKNSFLAYGPILHIMVVTLRCNHKCKYCHAAVAPMTASNLDMTKEIAEKVIDTAFYTTSPNLTLEFQWWEPLVNWDVVKYSIEYAYEKSKKIWKKVNFCIVTNMSLMTKEILNFLLNYNVSISTSLDWPEELHNYNRTYKEGNSYENVVKWIQTINNIYKKEWKKLGFLGSQESMWVLLTVTKKTLSMHKELIDTYVNNWIDWIFIRPLNPYWFAAADLKELGYTTLDFLKFYKKSLDYIIEINKSWKLLREHFASIFLWKIFKPRDPNYLDDRSPCWASIGQVAYNYDWKIYSCDEWRMLARMWVDDFQIWEVLDDSKKAYENMIKSDNTNIMVQSSTLDWMPWYTDSVYKTYIWVCPIHNYKNRWSVYPNYSLDPKKQIEYWVIDYLFIKMKDPQIKEIFKKWVLEPERAIWKCDI